jgi:aryl-alcohol dehydrogenase-like predicted oxidoreductase
MLYKNLGSSNLKIPAIGQGATHVGSYDCYDKVKAQERIKVWRTGIELGMNYIDTAALYGGGLSEELVGKAIKGIRDDVILATKFNPDANKAYSSIIASAEESLRRLATDRIDLYQIHFPNPSVPVEPMVSALHQLVREGKVRYIGTSNFSVPDLQVMQVNFPPGIVSNQGEYNLSERSAEGELLPYCQQCGITFIAYSPLAQGKLSLLPDSLRTLKALAEKYGKTTHQLVLRWLVSKAHVIAVTKAATLEHVKENAEAADFAIDSGDLAAIDRIAAPPVVHVSADRICVESPDARPTYLSLEEAMKNAAGLIPSPELLAWAIISSKSGKPVQLTQYKDHQGRFQYKLDPYDFLGQLRKYWAWIIAYGEKEKIPAYITS